MSEEEARKRQIEAARATREYAPVMAQEVSMSEHTPGPWKSAEYFNGDCLRVIQSGSGATIAKMSKDWPGIDIEANARLIAAAPALLVALEEWNAIWCGLAERGGPASPGARTWLIAVGEQAWNKAREAIKEVKGE